MLYRAGDKALVEVVSHDIAEERFAELAAMRGRVTDDGDPIELVQLVFIRPGSGEEFLQLCKRYGVGCRAFGDDGVERVLYEGQRSRHESEGRAEGTLLPLLREEKWPYLDTVVHRRLISGPAQQGPWVTFGIDMGETVARFGPQHLGEKTFEDVERRALENLTARDMQIQEIGPGLLTIADEYAAESILLPDLMRELQARLGARMMLVNIPTERRLVAANGEDVERSVGMTELARKHFEEASGRRISPLPLIVQDGAVIGYVTVRDGDEKDEKPWWKFW